jgi:hypothetical protein
MSNFAQTSPARLVCSTIAVIALRVLAKFGVRTLVVQNHVQQ